MAKLFIVGTPIGNLEDITLRALKILSQVSCVLAEDTRVSGKLLKNHQIKNNLKSFHAHSGLKEMNWILNELEKGHDLALITDAGTPGISDPGSRLVDFVRNNLPETEIMSVPGPSALTSALSVAGILRSDFVFLGFLPHKKGRQTLLKEIAESSRPMVFYESTHRIEKLLEELNKFLSNKNKKIFLIKEISKIYENVLIGSAEKLIEKIKTNPELKKGEFVVIVE